MKQIALDTNAYSDFERGIRWGDIVPYATQVTIPLPVLAELRQGFICGSQSNQNEQNLKNFLNNPTVHVQAPDEETTHYYARIYKDLRDQGLLIPNNDIWIASLCLQHNLWLCTIDKHFDHLPHLLRHQPTR